MSERYTRIFEGESDLYTEGSPVMISAAVLLNDTETGRVIAQMKFRSLSEKRITYLKVRAKPFDMLKNALSPVEFEYTDLSADMYDQFGQKTPVILSDASARSYEAAVIGAAFSDGTVWKSSETEWHPDPEREKEAVKAVTYNNAVNVFSKAKEADGYKKAAELFKKAYGFRDADALAEQCLEKAEVCRKDAVYTFAVSQVAEHTVNGYEAAIRNFRKIPGWKDADKQIIDCNQKIEEIKAKEEADRIEAERKAEELRIKREKTAKKCKKIVAIVTPVIVACVAFFIVLTKVIIPNSKYNAALELYNAGKYEEARSAFITLNGYKDSIDQIKKCNNAINEQKFNAALELYNAGKYDEAITAFAALNGYKDSTDQITKCENAIKDDKYNAALELYNAGKYDEAITAFTALNGYKDSSEQIIKCENAINEPKYNAAIDLYNAGKYDEAYKAFNSLDYKDSAGKAAECLFLKQKSGLTSVKVGSNIKFGFYEQDNNTSNGKEEVEWKVLAVEGNKALVISKYALDCQRYNSTNTSTTWEECTLRTWLNETFYNTAFGSNHQKMILKITVNADNNPSYNTSPGNNTTDNVFMLSITEVNKYFSSDSARQCQGTIYCYSQGAYKAYNGNCCWWLRSPGSYPASAASVVSDGSVYDTGYGIDYNLDAVRPAMWISIED